MENLKGWLKNHPYLAGGIVIGVGILFLILRRSSGGGSATATAIAGETQLAQTQAASQAATAQVNAQVQAAQIQANVAQSQISAAVNAQNTQTAAALVATLYNTQQAAGAQNLVTTESATLQNHAIDASVIENTNNNASKVSGLQSILNYYTGVNQNNNALISSTIGQVNGSQNRTALALGAIGDTSGSVAAENGQTASSASGDKLISGLASTGANLLVGLFG